jgi:hypothetical protein
MMRFIGSGMRFISAGCWLIAAMLILSSALFGADTGVRPLIQTQGNSAELSLPGTDAIKTGGLSKDLPAWTPVIYPNNPATVYGIVTIEEIAVAATDQISAFAGDECRGTGTVVLNNGQAFTTMLVNLAVPGETVIFKVYDSSADLIYNADGTQVLSFGQTLGEATPYPISVLSVTGIEAPHVTIIPRTEGFRLSWTPVTYADRYRVISKSSPDAPDSLVFEVTTPYYDELVAARQRFFRVIAIHDDAAGRGAQ